MFCPECESEYREGILECRDCGVALVATLAPPLQLVEEPVAPLAETHDPLLVEALIDALEKAEVPYVITAGTGLALLDRPSDPLEEPGAWEARIVVHAERFDEAREIYRQLRPNAP